MIAPIILILPSDKHSLPHGGPSYKTSIKASTSYRLTQTRLMSTKNNESNSEDKPSSTSTSKQGGKGNIPFKTYI